MTKRSLGQFIAALRKENGLTQQELADRLCVSNKSVSRWERDECAPDISLLPPLAELFGVSCDELLRGERARPSDGTEEPAPRMQREARLPLLQALSSFKTLIWIAIALAVVGLILMFGISYGFYRPVIGFTVMLLLEACATVMTILALTRAKDEKREHELFEPADASLLARFCDTLGHFSFVSFYLILSAVLLSLPFLLIRSNHVSSVISPDTYLTVFFLWIVLLLALVYVKLKEPYLSWILDEKPMPPKESPTVTAQRRKANVIQLGSALMASVSFVSAPYFAQNPDRVSFACAAMITLGLLFVAVAVAAFVYWMLKKGDEGKPLRLTVIRNVCLLPSVWIVSELHSVRWSYEPYLNAHPTIYTRCDLWSLEYLFYALAYSLLVFAVFTFLELVFKKARKD